jgi:hypothetical protein
MTKKQSATYIQFYKVMLILSTIGTALATLGFLSLPETINDFHVAPAYHVTLLLNYVVVLVSIVALVLLWKKRVEGIQLKIGTYIAFIVLSLIGLFLMEPYVQHLISVGLTEAGSAAAETGIVITLVTKIVGYGALVFSIIIDVVFMLLWRSAWKKQVEEDG